jgi:hypothetical protein
MCPLLSAVSKDSASSKQCVHCYLQCLRTAPVASYCVYPRDRQTDRPGLRRGTREYNSRSHSWYTWQTFVTCGYKPQFFTRVHHVSVFHCRSVTLNTRQRIANVDCSNLLISLFRLYVENRKVKGEDCHGLTGGHLASARVVGKTVTMTRPTFEQNIH